MGGLVLAMIAGVLVPVIGVLAVAAGSPVPRACSTGQATSTNLEGAILYSTGADLWYSEGFPGRPRKLVDYAPPRARPAGGATPSASVSAAASPSAGPSPSASASASPAALGPRVLAADISTDRKTVALLVLDSPDRPGTVSLRLLSPLDPPGTAPLEAWLDAAPDRTALRSAGLRFLDSGKVLVFEPEGKPLTAASPAPAPAAPAAASSPSATPSARATPSGAATRAGSPTIQAVIVAAGPEPAIAAYGSQQFLYSQGRTAWPDARGYRPPTALPEIRERVDGPNSSVAGIGTWDVATPLVTRHLNQLVLGTAGQSSTRALCTVEQGTAPDVFSPDGSKLALLQAEQTVLIDLSGAHAVSHLLDGAVLAWRS